MTAPPPFIELRGVSKQFPGVRALDGVNLAVRPGEVVGLVGENGAGKSTLIKIIGGIYQPDGGELWIDGRPVTLAGVRPSMEAGIALIHQELNLADSLSVAENLFLGKQPYRLARWLPVTDRRRLAERSAELLGRVGLACSPWMPVARLSAGQRQLVEVAKALAADARLLVFDEPTSSLSLAEAGRLLRLIRQLRDAGATVLYVSHRLGEVRELADRVVVLRDGRQVGELRGTEIEHDHMVALMVGRDIRQLYRRTAHAVAAEPALRVTDLRYPAAREPIRFHVGRGEIVGLAGLVGAGRTELARALFGIDPLLGGRVEVAGRPVHIRRPHDAIAAGVFLVPEERRTQGLVLQDPVADNITLPALPRLARGLVRRRPAEHGLAARQAGALSIRAAGLGQPVSQLSGGNQQKVVLARWLALGPRVLILDEPTRGVDVGAKAEIYALIGDLAAAGVGILMISSDMEEVLGVCDRVLVMYAGAIRGELAGPALTEHNVLTLALGATP